MLEATGEVELLIASVEVEVTALLWISVECATGEAYALHEKIRAEIAQLGVGCVGGAALSRAVGNRLTELINARIHLLLPQMASTFSELAALPVMFVTRFSGPDGSEDLFVERLRAHRLIPELDALATANIRFRKCPVDLQFRVAQAELLRDEIWHLERSEGVEEVDESRSPTPIGARLAEARRVFARLDVASTEAAQMAMAAIATSGNSGATPPLAIRVDGESSSEEQVLAAACLEVLGRCCDLSQHDIRGKPGHVARAGHLIEKLSETGWQLRTLAAWLRALGALENFPLCDLCYRHRVMRKRCRIHKASGTQSKQVRQASSIVQGYLRRYRESIIPKSSCSLMLIDAIRNRGNLNEFRGSSSRDVNVQMALLKAILMPLQQILHPRLASEVLALANRMISIVEAIYSGDNDQSRSQKLATDYQRRDQACAFLSLTSLLTHVYATGIPRRWTCFGVCGLGVDVDHPLVRTGALNLRCAVDGFIRHAAWTEEMEELEKKRAISGLTVEKIEATRRLLTDNNVKERGHLAGPPVSHRDIAAKLGVSHTAVRKALLRAAARSNSGS